jgi:hypothetical protein
MKRLWLIPPLAAAAIAAGCGSRPQPPQGQGDGGWQTCTDQQGRVVDERQCDSRSAGYRPGLYHWYYYPYGGRPYPLGYGVPLGGTYSSEPRPGVPTQTMGAPGGSAPRSGVVRGGFGKTAGSGGSAAGS